MPIIDNNSLTWKVEKSISNKEFSINSTTPRFSKNFEILELNHILDDPKPFALLKLKPNNMSLISISEIINAFPNSNSHKLYPYKYRKAQIICNFASSFFAVICALALIFWKQPSSKGAIIGLSILFSLLYYILFQPAKLWAKKGFFIRGLLPACHFLYSLCLLQLFYSASVELFNFSDLYTFNHLSPSEYIGNCDQLISDFDPIFKFKPVDCILNG